MELEVQTTSIARMMRVKCLVVQQGELAPRTQEHPSQERVGTSMLTQCTLGIEVAHAKDSVQGEVGTPCLASLTRKKGNEKDDDHPAGDAGAPTHCEHRMPPPIHDDHPGHRDHPTLHDSSAGASPGQRREKK
jgi:hypothetical protein